VGESEEHQIRLAPEVLLGDPVAVLIGQLKRPADGRGRRSAAELPGSVQEDAEENDQAGKLAKRGSSWMLTS
jgi:hypothetical protein